MLSLSDTRRRLNNPCSRGTRDSPVLNDAEEGIERADRRLESFNHGRNVSVRDRLARQARPVAADGVGLDVAGG